MESEKIDLRIQHMDPSLYNSDLAPLPPAQRAQFAALLQLAVQGHAQMASRSAPAALAQE